MRKSWYYWSAAAALQTLGLLGCSGDTQQDGTNDAVQIATGRGSGKKGPAVPITGAGVPSWKGGSGPANLDPPANDTCTGEVVALSADDYVQVSGTLADANDDYTTFCADTSSDPGNPDVVYQLVVAEEISLTVVVTATNSDFVPALSLRLTACYEENGGDTCLDMGGYAEHKQLSLPAGTYWLVIDSADGNTGDFTAEFYTATPSCGDGIVNTGEQCDPGTNDADDGCYDPGTGSQCMFGETPSDSSLTACEGYGPVSVDISDPGSPTITTLGPHNNGAGAHLEENFLTSDPSICGTPAIGPENVYHVVPTSDGTLHARIGYNGSGTKICDLNPLCADFILYMRSGTCAPSSPEDPDQQLSCQDFSPDNDEVLNISAAVTANSDYWIFVDGLDDQWGVGPYYLELWLVP